MLGKLMKYEWKNIWKAGTLMLLGMLVVTVIECDTELVCTLFLCGNTDPVCDHAAGVYLGNADFFGHPLLPQYVYG